MLSGTEITRLAVYGGIGPQYGSFAGKIPAVVVVAEKTSPRGGWAQPTYVREKEKNKDTISEEISALSEEVDSSQIPEVEKHSIEEKITELSTRNDSVVTLADAGARMLRANLILREIGKIREEFDLLNSRIYNESQNTKRLRKEDELAFAQAVALWYH
jgi:hypothetical protein